MENSFWRAQDLEMEVHRLALIAQVKKFKRYNGGEFWEGKAILLERAFEVFFGEKLGLVDEE